MILYFSDLYGAIGFPLRLSRTVITGRKPEVIRRLLYVLSYFIRCSEVCENQDSPWSVMGEVESLSGSAKNSPDCEGGGTASEANEVCDSLGGVHTRECSCCCQGHSDVANVPAAMKTSCETVGSNDTVIR